MSILFFLLALFWTVAAYESYGDTFFWLFIAVAIFNIFEGIRRMKKQRINS
jgi:hypothetical protein